MLAAELSDNVVGPTPFRSEQSDSAVMRVTEKLRNALGVEPRFRRPRAYTNWLRANYELLMRRSDIRARPLKLIFDPTNYCQLECPLCPTGARVHDRARGTAQLHIFEHLMEEVGDFVFLVDFFNWGEPLLNPHTEEFISLANRRGIVTALSTNLSLHLSDSRLERLIQSGLSRMIVSLDGASVDTYAMYRRQGHFDLVIDNMRRLVAMRRKMGVSKPKIDWQFLVFKFNEHELPLATALAREIGVDALTFRAPFLDEDRFAVSDADRALIATWTPSDPQFDTGRLQAAPIPERPRCGWHYMATAINYDGTVTPCCTVFEKKDDFGRLAGTGPNEYQQTVNNDRFRAVRDSFAGRRPHDTNLVCDHCPTPSMMGYHHHLNRQIALYSLASLIDAARHPFRRLAQRRKATPILSTAEAVPEAQPAAVATLRVFKEPKVN